MDHKRIGPVPVTRLWATNGGSTEPCSQSTRTGLMDSVKKRQRRRVGERVKCHIVQELRRREAAHGALEPGHGQSRTVNKRDGAPHIHTSLKIDPQRLTRQLKCTNKERHPLKRDQPVYMLAWEAGMPNCDSMNLGMKVMKAVTMAHSAV
ncbi:hypothetical protein EYF80_000814 [Liparis tanakae]|uniref:Uncharacterized protein n=1 Tax=Liparis tanakae TaxID=230148 RepID=A0A4Z2JFA4_9TELE|nr:hypothetical protein EYF80_000814 [Liparis tanakae]